jgi:hypothetical protein
MTRFLAPLLLLAATLLPAQEAGLYVRYSQWSTDLSGDVETDELWDLTKDLALKSDNPRSYGILYRGVHHRFSAEACDSSVSETITAGEGLVIAGEPVEPGTEIRTSMEMRTLGVEYWYHLVSVPSFRTGIILGADRYELETRIQDLHYSEDKVIPYVGLGITALTPRQGIYMDVALTVGEGSGASHLSGRIETGMDIVSGLGLFAGLRKVKVEMEGKNAQWDLENSSYYLGAQIHF